MKAIHFNFKKPSKRFLIEFLLFLFLIASVAVAVFLFTLYRKSETELKKLSSDPKYAEEKAKEETTKLIAEVEKIILLPKDETPIVATIMDIDKLKSAQPFFTNAKNGDRVLVYSTKAFIYDPITRKIIETGPVTPASASAQTKTFRLTLLNGTKTTGLTKKFEDMIKAQVSNIEVIKASAKSSNHTKSIIVDLNGTKPNETQQLAQFLEIQVGPLPTGETRPEGEDFLVVLGSDKETPLASPSPATTP